MKKMMAFGGLAGFSLSMACGLLSEGTDWPAIFLRSSVVALASGLLLRWWLGILARCLSQAQADQQAATPAKPVSPFSAFAR